MKIEINKVEDSSQESVVFYLHEVTPVIERVVSILEKETYLVLVSELKTSGMQKVKLSAILYVEYLERAVYLYTANNTYFIKTSLKKVQEILSPAFIQVSKNMFVNVYHVHSFVARANGNLEATLTSEEKIIVSRRYIRHLKNALEQLTS